MVVDLFPVVPIKGQGLEAMSLYAARPIDNGTVQASALAVNSQTFFYFSCR